MANNQTVVYDISRNQWVGVWEGLPATGQRYFTYRSGDDERWGIAAATGHVWRGLSPHSYDDNGTHPGMVYEHVLEIGDQASRYITVEVDASHEHGAMLVYAVSDGENEAEGPLLSVPDHRKYETFSSTNYDESNVNDDQLAPHREDYGVIIPGDSMTTLDETLEDDAGAEITDDLGDGIVSEITTVADDGGLWISSAGGWAFGAQTRLRETMRIRNLTKSIMLRIETCRGRVSVERIGIRAGLRTFGRKR